MSHDNDNDDDYDQKYTHPDLRREIKDALMQGDKGGRPGQWSARKAQLLVQEYERRGGGYKIDRKDADAQSLQEWTNQNWQTAEGSAYADDGSKMKRYLPEKAWDLLSEEQKREAEQKKAQGDGEGKQFVANTVAAKAARIYVDRGDASELTPEQLRRLKKTELMKLARERQISGRSSMRKDELVEALRKDFENDLSHMTRDELYARAQQMGIPGRSEMDKDELVNAMDKAGQS